MLLAIQLNWFTKNSIDSKIDTEIQSNKRVSALLLRILRCDVDSLWILVFAKYDTDVADLVQIRVLMQTFHIR